MAGNFFDQFDGPSAPPPSHGTFSTQQLASPMARSPLGARGLIGAAARVQGQQEKGTLDASKGIGDQMQLLHNLARADDLVSGPWDKTPTGSMATNHLFNAIPGTLALARSPLQGFPGIPNVNHKLKDGAVVDQRGNLGELDKLASASALTLGSSAGGTDKSRDMASAALFGIDKDQATNQRNIDNMLRQTIMGLIDKHAQNYFMGAAGDLNAVDPATGMNYAQFMSHIAATLPTSGYGPKTKLPRYVNMNNGKYGTIPGLSGAESDIENVLRGAASPAAPGGGAPGAGVQWTRDASGRPVPAR